MHKLSRYKHFLYLTSAVYAQCTSLTRLLQTFKNCQYNVLFSEMLCFVNTLIVITIFATWIITLHQKSSSWMFKRKMRTGMQRCVCWNLQNSTIISTLINRSIIFQSVIKHIILAYFEVPVEQRTVAVLQEARYR